MTPATPRFAPSLATAGCLLAAVLAVYGFTLGFSFVYDDHVQIERNPWLRAPEGMRLFLTRPFWGFDREQPRPSNYYRPVFGAFDSLLARVHGLDPKAFHAASVALHLAVCLLVALGARRLIAGGNAAAPLAAGLLFAVHPAHAEAVAWVGGQADLLAAVFALIAILAYLRGKDSPSTIQNLLLGPAAYLLACLAKETGVATLLVLLVVEATEWRREGSLALAIRRAAARLAPYGVVLALYLALRLHALGGFAPRSYGVTASAAGAVAYALSLLARYLGFLAVPFPAQILTVLPVPRLLSPIVLTGLAAAGLALGALAWATFRGRGRRDIVVSVAFVFAFLLPVLRADAIGGSNLAERYLYLPSVGLAWLAGVLASRLARSPARRLLTAAALLGIAALGAAAGARAAIYRNDRTLFAAAVRANPASEIAHNNLGTALYAAGRLAEAEREYREALRLRPGAVAPLANLALVLERRGDLPGAKAAFAETLRRLPTHAVAASHLARLSQKP
ncbi:MAG TPA: tetratricopeptide repeat protein [Thermoanaerobaculia bacterium]|nr:tetratricopeptide repeat protein [Thermoanaerobaculia bacterium]